MLFAFRLATEPERDYLATLALSTATEFDGASVVDYLLKTDLKVKLKPNFLSQLVVKAAANGSNRVLMLFIERDFAGEALASYEDACITSAIRGGHGATLKLLIENETFKHNILALEKGFIHSARMGDVSILKSLSSAIQDSESYSMTLAQSLNLACAAAQVEAVEWLIHAGADLNSILDRPPSLDTPTSVGATQKMETNDEENCMWPRNALIATLQPLDRKKSRHSLREDKQRILEKDRRRRESIISLLLEHKADVNDTGGCTRTPLHIAVEYCSEEVVRSLIAHGAKVNSVSQKHGTPLQCAVRRERSPLPIVTALIEANAFIDFEENSERQCVILDEALKHFGKRGRFRDRGFAELESMNQVLSDGPGAVIQTNSVIPDRATSEESSIFFSSSDACCRRRARIHETSG